MQHIRKKILAISLAVILILGPIVILIMRSPQGATAVWFDDSYAYRHRVTFTHNADISSERAVTFTLDTAELITANLMQSDCDDTRFTDGNGKPLLYDLTGTCNNASTTYEIIFPSIVNGSNLFYVYYGNPAATNGEIDSTGYTALTPSGGDPSLTNPTTSGNQEQGPGPISYWNFDEGYGTTAYDGTSNAQNGSISGASWQTEDICMVGKCLSFDGSNDIVDLNNDAKIGAGSRTVIAWAYFDTAASAGDNHAIVIKRDDSLGFNKGWGMEIDSTGIFLTYHTAGVGASATVTDFKSTWHQYAHVFDGSKIILYFDGREVGSLSASAPTANNNVSVTAGGYGDASGRWWDGKIDDVKIYNYARTAAQIKADFKARGTSKGVSAQFGDPEQQNYLSNGLVGYWKMDESSGNATDSSGNAYTLTNNGATTFTTGKFANGSSHNGTTQYFSTATTISGIQTVAFWVNPASTTDDFINLIASSTYINSSSGTISATGFTSPSIYVNGVLNGTITAGVWNHIAVTTGTAVSASAFEAGRANGSYLDSTGKLDDVRIYNRALTVSEVERLYNWAPGPVGWWKLDENTGTTSVNDSSGNGNTGTIGGSMTESDWVSGRHGSSLDFDGVDDRVNRSEITTTTTNLTMTAWIYSNLSSANSIVFYNGNSGATGYGFYMNNGSGGSGNRITLLLGGVGYNLTGTVATISPNTWYHYAVTRDTSTWRLYINGVLNSTGTTNPFAPSGTGGTSIGANHAGGNPFNGRVDDVKFYNYARTAKQIVEDMNAGHPAPGSPIGSSVGYWKFDESTNNTCSGGTNDTCNSGSAGNVIDGAITGATWNNSGKFYTALNFAGSQYVTVPDNNSLDMTDEITLSTWAYMNSSNINNGLIYKGTLASAQGNYSLQIGTGTVSKVIFRLNQNIVEGSGQLTSNTTLNATTWYHIAATYSKTLGKMRIYINGLLDAENSFSTSITTNSNNVYIGCYYSSSFCFNGKMDDVRIYNLSLTADEVKLDFNRASSAVLGSLSTTSSGVADNSSDRSYCIPGDSSTCVVPLGFWKFDENTGTSVFDSSTGNFTGTWNGTGTHWSPGKIGSAGKFNGSDDYVITSNLTSGVTNFTYEAWIRPNFTPSDTNDHSIIDWQLTAGDSNRLYLRWENNTNGFYIDSKAAFAYKALPSFSANTWHYIAFTRGATNTGQFYWDGIAITTTKVSDFGGINNTNNMPVYIGNGVDGAQGWNGLIDDVRIFNYVRTPAQIAYDYNRGAPVAWYKFDECQGATANDSSLNANGATGGSNGTITPGSLGNTTAGSCNSGTATEMWDDGSVGKYNSSLGFDGSDDYITYGNTPARFQNLSTADFTVCAWIYPNTMGEGSLGTIINNYADDSGGWAMLLREISGDVKSLQFSESRPLGQTDTLQISVDNTITLGAWQQVCAVYTKSDNRATLYKDGIQLSLQTDTAGTGTSATDADNELRVGNRSTDTTRTFDGKIDDIRIFNYAMTATQIRRLYNEGSGVRFGPQTGSP